MRSKVSVIHNEAAAVSAALHRAADKRRAAFLVRFFKTAPGEYAHGDRFLGVTVPAQRTIAKEFATLPLREILKLLKSPLHEERLTALFIMVDQYRRGTPEERERLHRVYLRQSRFVNNWDLVDSSAEVLVGMHVACAPRPLLQKLVRSRSVWERRIAMIATLHFIRNGKGKEALWVAAQLLRDKHDLIHKAAGWMLREVGKRVDEKELRRFLDHNASHMPRTMLRYAIERLPPADRRRYLAVHFNVDARGA